ncbi:hypothetical protein OUZ56_003331 [Daphnia magna]|uniref:Uncharacterized protein n=1 Tax=Daphnia magna TaxID=35525 RepID=A0ABR0A8T8_9CRUS|nr:hypothetical protein OUZ56_003331 [Daphnia magna]
MTTRGPTRMRPSASSTDSWLLTCQYGRSSRGRLHFSFGNPSRTVWRRDSITGSAEVAAATEDSNTSGSAEVAAATEDSNTSGLASFDPSIVSTKLMRAENDCGPSAISSDSEGRSTGERDRASAITHPNSDERVALHGKAKAQNSGIIQLVQVVIVEDRNQRAMICNELEGGQALEKLAAFSHSPSRGQAFQLDHRVSGLCIR